MKFNNRFKEVLRDLVSLIILRILYVYTFQAVQLDYSLFSICSSYRKKREISSSAIRV